MWGDAPPPQPPVPKKSGDHQSRLQPHHVKRTAFNCCLNKQLLADAGRHGARAAAVPEEVLLTMIVRINDHAPPD